MQRETKRKIMGLRWLALIVAILGSPLGFPEISIVAIIIWFIMFIARLIILRN